MWFERALPHEPLPRRYQLSYEPTYFRFGLSIPVVENLLLNREMLAGAATRFGFKGKVGFRRHDSVITEDLDEEGRPEQLLTFYACLGKVLGSYALAAWTSFAVRQWIEENFNDEMAQKIKEVLLEIDIILCPRMPDENFDYRRYELRVNKNPGRGFVVDIPGNACGLYVAGNHYLMDNQGLQFETHNVDSPRQQFLFLIFLAMICDAVERK